MKKRTALKHNQGFSLAEMMVVIVIIGLLVTMVVPNVLSKFGKAQLTKAKGDINQINQAIQEYAMDNGRRYPDSLDQLIEENENGDAYLKAIPQDPWKNDYQYDPPSGGGDDYRIYSLGKDGDQGGEGDNADIDQISILK
jgi:general secretion pathway protein G